MGIAVRSVAQEDILGAGCVMSVTQKGQATMVASEVAVQAYERGMGTNLMIRTRSGMLASVFISDELMDAIQAAVKEANEEPF